MSIPNSEKPIVAAFDFDGTITTRDSLLPFLLFSTDKWTACKKLLSLSPIFLGYLIGVVSRQKTKEHVLRKFFNGVPYTKMLALGKAFAASSHLLGIVSPQAQKRIKWHLEQGHRCILVSASIDVYLSPWSQAHGMHDVITSRLHQTAEGTITGCLDGLNCWGPEKTRRLEEMMGPRHQYILYAYGDSRGDQELLKAADYPFYRQMPATEGIPKP